MPITRRVEISDTISDYEDSQEKDQLVRLQKKFRKEEVRIKTKTIGILSYAQPIVIPLVDNW